MTNLRDKDGIYINATKGKITVTGRNFGPPSSVYPVNLTFGPAANPVAYRIDTCVVESHETLVCTKSNIVPLKNLDRINFEFNVSIAKQKSNVKETNITFRPPTIDSVDAVSDTHLRAHET